MSTQTQQTDLFKQQLRQSLQRESLNSRTVKIARHANVYTCGDHDEMVYFIESGEIKLLVLSPKGKSACWRSTAREIFSASYALSGSERASWKPPSRWKTPS
jgi:CRP-like cAMP-binding protein